MARYLAVLPAQTAGGADVIALCDGAVTTRDDGGGSPIPTRITLIPPPGFTTVTGTVAPNNATISVRQLRAGSVVATVAALTLAVGTNLVAETPVVIPAFAGAASWQTLSASWRADDVIDVLAHQNGTGLAIGAGLVVEVEITGR